MRCSNCNNEVPEKDIYRRTEELYCQHCKKWRFYGKLTARYPAAGGGTMKPDNVTEQLKREYDGKTDYYL